MLNILANCGNQVMAALAVGLSCGTACSPLVNLFLTTYTMGHFNSMRQGLLAFGCFWSGKTAVVIGMAFGSAVLGQAIVGQNGRIFGFNSKLILDMGMILTGVLLLVGMLLNRRKTSKCGDCGALDHEIAGAIRPTGVAPLVIMGVAYGLTPCAPLLMILVLAAMMTPFQAVLLSLVFSIANAISPLIILSTLAGFLSQRMQREIPRLLWVFQINTFGLFIVLGSVSLYRHW